MARFASFLDKPNARLDREIQIALRLGAFQLLHMDRIPAHAAIDESVELAKQAGHRFAARMVNAVLRKIAAAPRSAGFGCRVDEFGNRPDASCVDGGALDKVLRSRCGALCLPAWSGAACGGDPR